MLTQSQYSNIWPINIRWWRVLLNNGIGIGYLLIFLVRWVERKIKSIQNPNLIITNLNHMEQNPQNIINKCFFCIHFIHLILMNRHYHIHNITSTDMNILKFPKVSSYPKIPASFPLQIFFKGKKKGFLFLFLLSS